MLSLTAEQARRLLVGGHGLLSRPATGVSAAAEAARRVCGLQAQDLFAATLGVRVRSTGVILSEVEQARLKQRSVVWTWAMRGTLHLLPAEDAHWLLPLLGPPMVAAGARRRAELGITDEKYARAARAIVDRLAHAGPATREELVDAIGSAGLEAGYPVTRHVLYRAAFEGLVCLGPDRTSPTGEGAAPGAKPTYVLLEEWLGGSLRPVADEDALARLASRYLDAYAPATLQDLAAWSGLAVSMLRRGWDSIRDRLLEVSVEGRSAWVPRGRLAELEAPPLPDPHVRLLPAFDTYLLGHRRRDLVLDPQYAGRINAGGGMISAVILVNGTVIGTWRANRKGRQVHVAVEPFAPMTAEVRVRVDAEIADIGRFLDDG